MFVNPAINGPPIVKISNTQLLMYPIFNGTLMHRNVSGRISCKQYNHKIQQGAFIKCYIIHYI